MIWFPLVLLALLPTTCVAVQSLAAEAQRPLDFRTISLNGDKGGMLAVIDGQPRLVNSRTAWTEWTLRETEKGWTIQDRLSREKPEVRFLGVDAIEAHSLRQTNNSCCLLTKGILRRRGRSRVPSPRGAYCGRRKPCRPGQAARR